MIDLFTRAILHPADYMGARHRRELIFTRREEHGDFMYSYIFEMPIPFFWQAGQHAIFTLPGKNVGGKTWRPFSIASSPHENEVRIGTIVSDTPSDFKYKLNNLIPGDIIALYGPFGEFHAHIAPQHIVGIAGGIGITPFRALAYDISHGHLPNTKLTLLYAARNVYAYKNELLSWQNEHLSVICMHTPDEVQAALATQFNTVGNHADYYISGSPGMIGTIQKICLTNGITKIVNDPFKGY